MNLMESGFGGELPPTKRRELAALRKDWTRAGADFDKLVELKPELEARYVKQLIETQDKIQRLAEALLR